MKIGILGSGTVAQTLAQGFATRGHEVFMGSREPQKLVSFVSGTTILALSLAEAAQSGELLVLAVKGSAALEVLQLAGIGNFDGKTVIDTTNPIADAPPEQGVLRFFTGPNDSLMERLQDAAPQAHFVKAWNSVGSPFMVDPRFPGGKPTMFYCGNDSGAKETVAEFLVSFGWEPEDMGKAASARALEPLCQLWCAPGFLRNQWAHAFHLLRM